MTGHPILCSALKSFSWRSTHGALYTREKLSQWGISNGICPFCTLIESIEHVFWKCPALYQVLCWVFDVTKRLIGTIVPLDQKLFMYGVPCHVNNVSVWGRLWFICVIFICCMCDMFLVQYMVLLSMIIDSVVNENHMHSLCIMQYIVILIIQISCIYSR